MNQILLTNNQNIKRKSSGNYSGNNSSGDMKKIIIFFAIAILVFAIAIIGVYVFKMSKENKKEKKVEKPELSIEQIENQVKIISKAEAGINKIIYTWNDGEPTEKEMNGRTSHEEALDIPEGQNILKVVVIDENNNEIESSKEFYIEETSKPIIEIDETIGNGKVKITAIDENNFIKYITYKWNDEQEITVEAEGENQTIIEKTIDVKRGKNKLTIAAVNGLLKTETIEKTFNGVNNPIVEVTRDGNVIYMKITHDMGLKKIAFTVNGQEYIYDESFSGYDSTAKEIEYKYDLKEGENTVIIYAVSNETTETTNGIKNTETMYRGKCDYITE